MTSLPPVPATAGSDSHPHTDKEHTVSEPSTKQPSLPPRWFIRSFWVAQRAVYSVTGRRLGLRTAAPDHAGICA